MNNDKQFKLDLRYLRMARIWSENSYCKGDRWDVSSLKTR